MKTKLAALLVLALCAFGCASQRTNAPVNPESDWFIGLCYGPFREGQAPGGAQPTDAQLLEDLRILENHVAIIRVYSSMESTPHLLRLIDQHSIDIRVVVGAWLACEHAEDIAHVTPDLAAANAVRNREEVLGATALANQYPDIVAAIAVGNETQVYWSGHRLRRSALMEYINLARANTNAPITVADDFAVWADPSSTEIAAPLDFLIVHAYAAWNGAQLEDAVAFTEQKLNDVRAVHPDKQLVLGELGWPTSVASEGEQAELIKGKVGAREQRIFTRDIIAWATRNRVPLFLFEAFDEPWKGGPDPAEVEKHWGHYKVDRTPKPAAAMLPRR